MTPTIALATVADVLNSKGMEAWANTTDLATLEAIADAIHDFSLTAEQDTGRWFKKSTVDLPWTEVLDVECGQRVFALRAYPVASIVSIKSDADSDFASATALDPTSYALHQGGRTGQVILRSAAGIVDGPQTLQITYVGGLALDVHQIPANLRRPCIEQVLLSLKRPENVDISGKAQSGGSVTYFRNTPLCTNASAAIDRYRRHW